MIAHVPVTPLPVSVRAEFLHDLKAGHGELVDGTLFAVSSYTGHVLTFQVLLESGGVFSYLPPHAVVTRAAPPPQPDLELGELVYHDCPDDFVCATRFDALDRPVRVWFKGRGLWLGGRYLFTVDWYRGNDMLHIVALENGQHCALPSHKMLFGGPEPPALPGYKKMHQSWKVGR